MKYPRSFGSHVPVLAVLLSCLSSIASAQSVSAERPAATTTSLEGAVVVRLAPADPEVTRLGWSPKGAAVVLEASTDGNTLRGEFVLGPAGLGGRAIEVELRCTHGSTEVNELAIDLNRNGTFDEDEDNSEVLTCEPNETRGKIWSSFSTVVPVPVIDPWGERTEVPYPMNLWYVRDPLEPEATPMLRWSRRGYFTGTCRLGDESALVMICEMDMDGILNRNDAWALAPASEPEQAYSIKGMRNLTDHAWLGEQAYRVMAIDASGLLAVIVPHDPGITRAEEIEQRDRLAVDRRAARSGLVVSFLHDFASAQAQAKAEGKPLFIDFETTWCGPCKQMDQWVYTADDVVAVAADKLIAVKVDGDESRDLVKQFKVTAYPTMILLDANGSELARNVGYIGVKETVEFLSTR